MQRSARLTFTREKLVEGYKIIFIRLFLSEHRYGLQLTIFHNKIPEHKNSDIIIIIIIILTQNEEGCDLHRPVHVHLH